MDHLAQTLIVVIAVVAPVRLGASSPTIENWDNGEANGWFGANISTTVVAENSGGNPGGYLACQSSSGTTGALTRDLPWVGDYTASWVSSIEVDIRAIGGDLEPYLRLRQSPSVNGWRIPIMEVLSDDGTWHRCRVDFHPLWTDQQAEAAGWSKEGTNVPSFAETAASVYSVAIGANAATLAKTLYIDNFRVSCVEPARIVPLPWAQGLDLMQVWASESCGEAPFSYTWRDIDTDTVLGFDWFLALDPIPLETLRLALTISDASGLSFVAESVLLVHPFGLDLNGDGINDAQDVAFAASVWGSPSLDADGDGVQTVLDLLHINTGPPPTD